MSWETDEITPDAILIVDGNVIVGSMARADGVWVIEILWSGPSGDIKADFKSYDAALAFVRGVEKTVVALQDMKL